MRIEDSVKDYYVNAVSNGVFPVRCSADWLCQYCDIQCNWEEFDRLVFEKTMEGEASGN